MTRLGVALAAAVALGVLVAGLRLNRRDPPRRSDSALLRDLDGMWRACGEVGWLGIAFLVSLAGWGVWSALVGR